MKYIYLFLIICFNVLQANGQQVLEQKINCKTNCGAAGDEKKNTKKLYMSRSNNLSNTKGITTKIRGGKIKFPLRFLFVSNQPETISAYNTKSKKAIEILNTGYKDTDMEFTLFKTEIKTTNIPIESLTEKDYAPYNLFSKENDLPNTISVYVFDYDPMLCTTSTNAISCGRTSGFSYILSDLTNNIVLSKFDIEDDKIIVHEMGHFMGLYHTFEEAQFGKDTGKEDCNVAGDCLCDTPPDPGALYEVYVNYSLCQMTGFLSENGKEFKPLIDNFMSYYKPCYLKPYKFTKDQIEILNMSAISEFRTKFSNN